MNQKFRLGAVAYAPKVVSIWEGFKEYFQKKGLSIDYQLYSNYETQVEALFNGSIDTAWNSPLAHLRAERIGKSKGLSLAIGPMRDTDQDLTSVLVVRKSSKFQSVQDLRGKTVGFGAIDSPQARLIPLDHLRQLGLVAKGNFDGDYKVRQFDLLAGKHGDHIGGEREAALALVNKEVDAAWMIDGNYQGFAQEGILPPGETQVLSRTNPYDHCIFTMAPTVSSEAAETFNEILLSMKWSDSEVRPLLELEGLKEWRTGRVTGFSILDRAIVSEKFYDENGNILEPNYRY